MHQGIECVQSWTDTTVAWSWYPQRWERKKDIFSKRSYHRLKGSSRWVLFVAEIQPEEGHADNAQRNAHHFLMYIQWLSLVGSLLPAFEHGGSGAGHLRRQASDALPVKGGLHQTSLVPPECTAREQQAIAQKGMQRLVGKDL